MSYPPYGPNGGAGLGRGQPSYSSGPIRPGAFAGQIPPPGVVPPSGPSPVMRPFAPQAPSPYPPQQPPIYPPQQHPNYPYASQPPNYPPQQQQQLQQQQPIPPYLRGSLYDREAQARIARDFFRYADLDGDRTLDLNEFYQILRRMGFNITPEDSRRLFHGVDTRHDGVLSEDEFVSWYVQYVARPSGSATTPYQHQQFQQHQQQYSQYPNTSANQMYGQDYGNRMMMNGPPVYADYQNLKRIARAMFYEADRDHSGYLDLTEFWVMLQRLRVPMNYQDAADWFSRADLSRDGKISPDEFERFYIDLCRRDNKLYYD